MITATDASTTNLTISGINATGGNRILNINGAGVVGTIASPLSLVNGGTNSSALTGSMLLATNVSGSTVVNTSTPTLEHLIATGTIASLLPYASSTAATFSGALFIPTTTALPAPVVVNQIAVNTTSASSSLQVGNFSVFATTTVSFTYPTSSPAGTSSNLSLQNGPRGVKYDSVACLNRGAAASSTVEVGNGVSTTTFQAGFTVPVPVTIATPILIDAWKTLYINIGTWGSANINNVTCGFGREMAY